MRGPAAGFEQTFRQPAARLRALRRALVFFTPPGRFFGLARRQNQRLTGSQKINHRAIGEDVPDPGYGVDHRIPKVVYVAFRIGDPHYIEDLLAHISDVDDDFRHVLGHRDLRSGSRHSSRDRHCQHQHQRNQGIYCSLFHLFLLFLLLPCCIANPRALCRDRPDSGHTTGKA